jgi:oligoribonuclease (3'-5' exoribonuclease)
MSNRDANKENTFSNLRAWCEKYHKESGLKVHPSSVPVDLVLEDLMGYIATLIAHDNSMTTAFDALNERVKHLQAEIINTNKVVLEATTLINAILETKETKKAKK